MSAPTAILQFGATSGILANNVKRNLKGLDSGTQQWYSPAYDTFTAGDALDAPFDNLYIKGVSSDQDGNEWVHNLDCIGLLSGADKREDGYPQIEDNLEGWDAIADSWVTTDPDLIAKGSAFGSLDMYCISRQVSTLLDVATPIYRVQARYKGFIDEKPYKRVITCNEQISSPKDLTNLLTGGYPYPWPNNQIAFPKVVVRDTLITTVPPPQDLIPGAVTPPDAPDILTISISGSELTRHWPHGWKLSSIDNYDMITGTDLYMYTLVYEYQRELTF